MYGFVGGLTGTASILTITCVALERLYVIQFPLRTKMTRRQSYIVILFIWCYALFFSSIPLLQVYSRYVPEGFLTACSFDYLDESVGSRVFILIFFAAAYVIPLTCIISSYVGIVWAIKRSDLNSFSGDGSSRVHHHHHHHHTRSKMRIQTSSSIYISNPVRASRPTSRTANNNTSSRPASSLSEARPSSSASNTRSYSSTSLEMKLVRIALFLISMWTISWTPYAVVALIGVSGNKHLLNPLSSMIPALFAKTASIFDPVIYGLSHPKFQKELRKLFLNRSRENERNQRRRKRRNEMTLHATRGGTNQPTNNKNTRSDEGDKPPDIHPKVGEI